MPSQLDLFPFRPPAITSDAERLLNHLHTNPGWRLATEILRDWDLPETDSRRRWLRDLAAQAEPDIISGQNGYLHIAHATPDEIAHFANWMESQARSMTARAEAIRRRAHTLIAS